MALLMHIVARIMNRETASGPHKQFGQERAAGCLLRTGLTLLLIVLVCPLLSKLRAQRNDKSLEYEVKAAFLFNFTKFVDWPSTAFASRNAPLTICIVGRDPFGAILDQTVEGETVSDREIRVRRGLQGTELRNCHILFISESDREQCARIFSSLQGSSVLTVSDLPGFVDAGGIIEFVLQGGKVQFEINAVAAETAG
jgi:YfiR/HmsC-like